MISLDYCADQFVIGLADRAQILAVSPEATQDFSYLRNAARGLPVVRPVAEDVLALRPDLVVRSHGGGPSAAGFFARAGIAVHQIGWGDDFDAVRTNVREAAAALGQTGRGAAMVARFDRRLAAVAKAGEVETLYLAAGGVTAGPGSMVDLMLRAAGLANMQADSGWAAIPLERLAVERPAMAAAAFFGTRSSVGDTWSAARHPVVRETLATVPVAALDGATTACGGWFVMDAVELLARTGRAVAP